MSRISQFLIGLLFGLGLVIAGMANPQKVLNFLDIAAIRHGTWDPSLMFVMGGGVIVAFFGYRFARTKQQPLFASRFQWPTKKDIDRPVIAGPAIFGLGWGLAGFCPGPAFTALGTTDSKASIFVVAMLIGVWAAKQVQRRTSNKPAITIG